MEDALQKQSGSLFHYVVSADRIRPLGETKYQGPKDYSWTLQFRLQLNFEAFLNSSWRVSSLWKQWNYRCCEKYILSVI